MTCISRSSYLGQQALPSSEGIIPAQCSICTALCRDYEACSSPDAYLDMPLVQGYHGDTSKMFMVGNVSDKAQELCRVTKHALDEAIKICGPGVPIREVGKVRLVRHRAFS